HRGRYPRVLHRGLRPIRRCRRVPAGEPPQDPLRLAVIAVRRETRYAPRMDRLGAAATIMGVAYALSACDPPKPAVPPAASARSTAGAEAPLPDGAPVFVPQRVPR